MELELQEEMMMREDRRLVHQREERILQVHPSIDSVQARISTGNIFFHRKRLPETPCCICNFKKYFPKAVTKISAGKIVSGNFPASGEIFCDEKLPEFRFPVHLFRKL